MQGPSPSAGRSRTSINDVLRNPSQFTSTSGDQPSSDVSLLAPQPQRPTGGIHYRFYENRVEQAPYNGDQPPAAPLNLPLRLVSPPSGNIYDKHYLKTHALFANQLQEIRGPEKKAPATRHIKQVENHGANTHGLTNKTPNASERNAQYKQSKGKVNDATSKKMKSTETQEMRDYLQQTYGIEVPLKEKGRVPYRLQSAASVLMVAKEMDPDLDVDAVRRALGISSSSQAVQSPDAPLPGIHYHFYENRVEQAPYDRDQPPAAPLDLPLRLASPPSGNIYDKHYPKAHPEFANQLKEIRGPEKKAPAARHIMHAENHGANTHGLTNETPNALKRKAQYRQMISKQHSNNTNDKVRRTETRTETKKMRDYLQQTYGIEVQLNEKGRVPYRLQSAEAVLMVAKEMQSDLDVGAVRKALGISSSEHKDKNKKRRKPESNTIPSDEHKNKKRKPESNTIPSDVRHPGNSDTENPTGSVADSLSSSHLDSSPYSQSDFPSPLGNPDTENPTGSVADSLSSSHLDSSLYSSSHFSSPSGNPDTENPTGSVARLPFL